MSNNKESWDGQLAAIKAQLVVGEVEGDSVLAPEDEGRKSNNSDEHKGVPILSLVHDQSGDNEGRPFSDRRKEAEKHFQDITPEGIEDRKQQKQREKEEHEATLELRKLENAAEIARHKSAKILNYSLAAAIGALSLGAVALIVRSFKK